jgi:membrane fusion protein (multidrug efflux system)
MRIRFGRNAQVVAAIVSIAAAFTIVSCTRTTSAAGAPPPPDVEIAAVEQKDIPVYHEWIGTLDGLVNAAIRAQVTGYLHSQNYTEGSFVRKGQLLFEIDPRPFQDAVDQAQGQVAQANGQLAQAKAQLVQAQAQLTSAEANQRRTQLDVDKYVPLNSMKAITQQEMDDAMQNNLSAKAQVEGAKAQIETAKAQIQAASAGVVTAQAALETARVNLGFTRLMSPIDGIAGVAQIQIGNLVSQTANPVTTVSTLDPVKVNFAVSDQEYLELRRLDTPLNRLEIDLILSDGTVYPHKGKFDFVDRQVTANTGAIQMTALFPNPGNILRPGQYGKARAAIATNHGALLIPQPAVTELQGSYQVAIVDDKNRVNIKAVKVGQTVGSKWVINDGLKPGQRVIAEGAQKVVAGMTVNPKPFSNETETTGGN